MRLNGLDFVVIAAFFAVLIGIGVATSRRAGKSTKEFFLTGRSMPWWLMGISMTAACTSTNSANLFTEIIRRDGLAGNWVWWAFLLTSILTVFVYAKLWHRSGVSTDIEFYELRYGGKTATFLRAFRCVYLGVLLNAITTAVVLLGAVKIAGVIFDLPAWQVIAITTVFSILYSTLGGVRGMMITDFFMFTLIFIGAIIVMVYAVGAPQVGGFSALMEKIPQVQSGVTDFFPSISNPDLLITVFVIPVAVQWWSVWYVGSEPGGGGYMVQRMLTARSENDSVGGCLFFNFVNYVIRPWPWYIAAFASILVFPDLESLAKAFPHMDPRFIRHDLAYPAMMTLVPPGLLGLVVASLLGALLSTVVAHLNMGAAYVSNDCYRRFIRPAASERELIFVGRMSSVLLMVVSALLVPFLESAKTAFDLLLQIGAGTGPIFLFRWFWWRINAWSEIAGMATAFLVALFLTIILPACGGPALAPWIKLLAGIAVTSVAWIAVTFATKPHDDATLVKFCRKVQPGRGGWERIYALAEMEGGAIPSTGGWTLASGTLAVTLTAVGTYAAMFAAGSWIYGDYLKGAWLTVVATISLGWVVRKQFKKGAA